MKKLKRRKFYKRKYRKVLGRKRATNQTIGLVAVSAIAGGIAGWMTSGDWRGTLIGLSAAGAAGLAIRGWTSQDFAQLAGASALGLGAGFLSYTRPQMYTETEVAALLSAQGETQ